jgi:subtilase family serine protease
MFKRRRGLQPSVDRLDDRCLLSGPSGLTPAQIAGAYGLNGIKFPTSSGVVKGDGTGETIALIEMYHYPNLASDLHTFDQSYGLPDPTLNVINQAGNRTDLSWGQEAALDVEWAHAIAPGAGILVVEAAPGYYNDQALQNLIAAVQTAAATPGVAVISMSWGFYEFPGEAQYDANFTTAGITYIAASGDTPGAEYPAASPDVLSVGGTSLTLGATGGYGSETAWSASGGGYSQFEAEPAYQLGAQTTGQRSVPDVAFDADPNTGAQIYYTPPPVGPGQPNAIGSWYTIGGTSLGAPSWAGIIAIVDQGRVLAGRSNLSGPTQTLPSLYVLASSRPSSGAFHPVAPSPVGITWSNGGGFPWGGWDPGSNPAGAVAAGATANTQTGLGTPNGPSLINGLAGSTTTAPLPSPLPTPTPTSAPTPTPSPTPTPTSTTTGGKHHHHHKPLRGSAQNQTHAPTTPVRRVANQSHSTRKHHTTA